MKVVHPPYTSPCTLKRRFIRDTPVLTSLLLWSISVCLFTTLTFPRILALKIKDSRLSRDAFQLPATAARSAGYSSETQQLTQMLNDKFSTIEHQISNIEKLLRTATDAPGVQPTEESPRFVQKSGATMNPTSSHGTLDFSPLLAYQQQTQQTQNHATELGNLQMSDASKAALQTLLTMFKDPALVRASIPPGTPSTTPDQLMVLIRSALSQSPNLDRSKLDRLLKVWSDQLRNYPSFVQLPSQYSAVPPVAPPAPFPPPPVASYYPPTFQSQQNVLMPSLGVPPNPVYYAPEPHTTLNLGPPGYPMKLADNAQFLGSGYPVPM